MTLRRYSTTLPALFLLAACASGSGQGPVQDSRPAPPVYDSSDTRLLALSVGAMAGSRLGGNVGRQLSDDDRARLLEATQRALNTAAPGETVFWSNAESGNSGSITPQDRFTTAGGTTCREFQQAVKVAGEDATAYGTACRQEDGRWTVVSG